MIESATSMLHDWMWAISQITFLDTTCVIVLLISEIRCSYHIKGCMGGKKYSNNALWCWVEPKHLLRTEYIYTHARTHTSIHTHKHLPSCRSKQEAHQKSFDKHALLSPGSWCTTPGRVFFYRQSIGKLLPCPSHDTLTERKVSISCWTPTKVVTSGRREGSRTK